MSKLYTWSHGGGTYYWFFCPACKSGHAFLVGVEGKPSWTFNGDMDAPTFEPSLRMTCTLGGGKPHCCHLLMRGGIIQFCGDCTHEMAGQSVPLVEKPDDYDMP